MARWRGQVYGFGHDEGEQDMSDKSATMQLSLVDEDEKPIPVDNSRSDFIMFIPRDPSQIPEPLPFGMYRNLI